jgi:hypothetical protein
VDETCDERREWRDMELDGGKREDVGMYKGFAVYLRD